MDKIDFKPINTFNKIKLESVEYGQFNVEEMIISDDGKILRVLPKVCSAGYEGVSFWPETCVVGEKPIILQVLGTYNLALPCIVTEVKKWIDEDYDNFSSIQLYPTTITDDYMGELLHKDLAIKIDKVEFYSIYQKYNHIFGIDQYRLEEEQQQVSFPVEINQQALKHIKSRNSIIAQIKNQLKIWSEEIPRVHFIIEYSMPFTS